MTLSVLIAEPSRTLASLMRLSLAPLGGELRMASDGREALGLARQWLPDLVIADASLQALDGYALAASIRRMPGGADVPILLTLADHTAPDPERLAYVGVSDVLHKPFERAALLARARALLEGRAAEATAAGPSDSSWHPADPRPHQPRLHRASAAPWPEATPTQRHSSGHSPTSGSTPAAPVPELEDLVREAVDERLEDLVTARVDALVQTQLDARLEVMVAEALTETLPPVLEQILPALLRSLANERLAELVEAGLPAALSGLARDTVRDAAEAAVAQRMPDVMEYAAFGLGPKVESVLRELLPGGIREIADKVVWKVVPEIAEDLIRVEIQRLLEAPEEGN